MFRIVADYLCSNRRLIEQLSKKRYIIFITKDICLFLKSDSTAFKVPITSKYFFRLNKSLHLFETHCAFLPLFNSNIDLLQAVKVTKSGHYLSHDRASKGYGSIPRLTSQTSLHACLQRLNTMQISL